MSDDIAIKVEHISKTFHEQVGARSFKEAFVNIGKKISGKKTDKLSKNFTALKDINFEVKKGEFFGIVGRNGSGKSTLLKIMAGVYTPTKGAVAINGNLTPFIELGVGFNPELSGRDNVFLNAALLGFSRKQTEVMYKDIVEFAELKEFMDVKLKNYSSGMQVRLAFSVAIRAESDILLIDEVLAVGDAAFQQKCFQYFDKLKTDNRTIIFVTHDMSSVRQFCDKALYLEKGKIIKISNPAEISKHYENKNINSSDNTVDSLVKNIKNSNLTVAIRNSSGKIANSYEPNDKIKVNINWNSERLSKQVENIGVIIYSGAEAIFATNTKKQIDLSKVNSATLVLNNNLGNGRYRVFVGLYGSSIHEAILVDPDAAKFSVIGNNIIGTHDDEWNGLFYIENEWSSNV